MLHRTPYPARSLTICIYRQPPCLCTLLLLHMVPLGKEVFHRSLCPRRAAVVRVLQPCQCNADFWSSSSSAPPADQYTGPSLRRLNLVAVDLLCHGDTVDAVPANCDREMADEEIVARSSCQVRFKCSWVTQGTPTPVNPIQGVIRVIQCATIGVAMGAMFAVQLAVSHPAELQDLSSSLHCAQLKSVSPPRTLSLNLLTTPCYSSWT